MRVAALQAFTAPPIPPPVQPDLDANPELLARLERLAAARGETFEITSGLRTTAEQQALWDRRASTPYPVARPGTSRHEHGNAADVTIGGRAIQAVIPRDELIRAGIAPLPATRCTSSCRADQSGSASTMSISTSAPSGSAATPIVLRAGGSLVK